MEKQRWEESERRSQEVRRSEKRKREKKEDAGARKGRIVAIHCVFPMICGSGGSKSKLAKAAGAEPAGQMRDKKLHAVVARGTLPSQNVQGTPFSDHFWKWRCRKSVRRCGAKRIFKSKRTKHTNVGPLLEVEMSKSARRWSTFPSENVKSTTCSDHFLSFRCRKSTRHCGAKHISKLEVSKTEGFESFLVQAAQSKDTWTCHKSHCIREFSGTRLQTKSKENSRGRLCASLCSGMMEIHMEMPKSNLTRELAGKTLHPKTGTTVLCEAAQSECAWTCQKSNFMAEFSGKMPQAKIQQKKCAVEMHLDVSQEQFHARILRQNAAPRDRDNCLCEKMQSTWTCRKSFFMFFFPREFTGKRPEMEQPDHAPAFIPSVKTLQCAHTVWGTAVPHIASHAWAACGL